MDAVVLIDPISTSSALKSVAENLGYKVIAIYTRPLTVYETQFHVDEKTLKEKTNLVFFSDDLPSLYEKLKNSPYKIRAVMGGVDSGVEMADQLAFAMQLTGNSIELSSARRDKGKMRRVQKEKGLTCPDFAVCGKEKDVIQYAKTHSFPLVIKTPRGAGTSHVYVCDDLENLKEKFHKIQDSENLYGETSPLVVVEDYIGGNEYIVNTFSDGKNVHVTDCWVYEKLQTATFKNITMSVILLPSSLKESKELSRVGKKIAESFGILRGPGHLEIKNDSQRGPTLIELAPRFCGANLPHFLKKYSNFDPFRACIEVFTKGECSFPESIVFSKWVALALCPTFQEGIIRKIKGIEKIQKLPSYESHILNVKVGDPICSTTYLTTTPLAVYLTHVDREELLFDLKKTHELFRIEVD
jgi:L-amino acid ligase